MLTKAEGGGNRKRDMQNMYRVGTKCSARSWPWKKQKTNLVASFKYGMITKNAYNIP